MIRSLNHCLSLFTFLISMLIIGSVNVDLSFAQDGSESIIKETTVFNEKDGVVAVEAEHFFKQTEKETRAFYLTARDKSRKFDMDGDPPHVGGASNGAYVEILPDTRRNHGEKLKTNVNFSNAPGKLAILHYKVNVTNPGRYYVWVRAHSTGSEDNGLHVGIDGEWPESGQRLQWCDGKRQWWWESKQRTEKAHCGVPHKIFLDIEKPGVHTIHFSMREDGFEFDKWLMTKDREFKRPADAGPVSTSNTENLPTFPLVAAPPVPLPKPVADKPAKQKQAEQKQANSKQVKQAVEAFAKKAKTFDLTGTHYYLDQDKWLAVNPDKYKTATVKTEFEYPSGVYTITLRTVGENDGQSTFDVAIGDNELTQFKTPLSKQKFEAGQAYHGKWKKVAINMGDMISISSTVGSADGMEFSRARWEAIVFRPADEATKKAAAPLLAKIAPTELSNGNGDSNQSDNRDRSTSPTKPVSSLPLIQPRQPEGNGDVQINGELKTWHKVTLTMHGPYAHEQDNEPNPYLDYRYEVSFTHDDGTIYVVPGYFAADGNAGGTSAESGTMWRAHFAPDRIGRWSYEASIVRGDQVAIEREAKSTPLLKTTGAIIVTKSDKVGRDMRAKGRLQYVGKRYLQHMGSKKYFLKAGADAPETLLGYADFDGTVARKKKVPLKTFEPHLQDWNPGDPTWKGDKGKGLIGAVNYLSGKGCNAFSFLTYNAGGDGDNVWPFIDRDDKLHYDCSKLDQWGVVFDHGTAKGMYLHFKMQETENDDHRGGKKAGGYIPTSLDGGNLGVQRKLYIRELVARFGHNLALNWNLSEESTQSTKQQMDMINYIRDTDPYHHNIVVHTFPDQQDKVYDPLLGDKSSLTGASLQNSGINQTHSQVVKWVRRSRESGKPWIIAFDESGTAAHGQCPDLGYRGFDGKDNDGSYIYDQHAVRRATLWGTFMGGGAGVEYYFGYKFAENDLVCEDWRSRDASWDYCRICLEFFENNSIPYEQMEPADEFVGNDSLGNDKYCLAKSGELYLVYLPQGGDTELDLSGAQGEFSVAWFNPRTGGALTVGDQASVIGGSKVTIKSGKSDGEDWLAVIRKK